jgi:glycine cleavage system regulatory protein
MSHRPYKTFMMKAVTFLQLNSITSVLRTSSPAVTVPQWSAHVTQAQFQYIPHIRARFAQLNKMFRLNITGMRSRTLYARCSRLEDAMKLNAFVELGQERKSQ